ncbi:hypothetical protein BS47DRAFT_1303452, partial [Hydnum rufescens UP504]
QNILLVQKPQDNRVARTLEHLISHIQETYPSTTLFHEPPSSHHPLPPSTSVFEPRSTSKPRIDLVVTLGGDGTILHASSLFNNDPVPPVLSFSLGTLGFLLPFDINSLESALAEVMAGHMSILPRMRLSCKIRNIDGTVRATSDGSWEVMNEVSLHRGTSPHLTSVDAYVDGQHLTAAVSDGLIISTPTGSTAYSLSSGGPIVHPSVKALLLTPVAPLSLSFRPLVLPGWSRISYAYMNASSRTSACVSMDGRQAGVLSPGESVDVEASQHPIPA